jgi:hypothetical protein
MFKSPFLDRLNEEPASFLGNSPLLSFEAHSEPAPPLPSPSSSSSSSSSSSEDDDSEPRRKPRKVAAGFRIYFNGCPALGVSSARREIEQSARYKSEIDTYMTGSKNRRRHVVIRKIARREFGRLSRSEQLRYTRMSEDGGVEESPPSATRFIAAHEDGFEATEKITERGMEKILETTRIVLMTRLKTETYKSAFMRVISLLSQ